MNEIRKEVADFALAMEKKLASKDEEFGNSWKQMSYSKLFFLLEDHVHKLWKSIYDLNFEKVPEDAVDIANFAMVLHDNMTR